MDDKLRNLRLLKEEDIVWYIYFFIVTFAIIANSFEEKFIYTGNHQYQKSGRKINITLLIIAFIIYLYYVAIAIEDVNIARIKDERRQRVAMERLIKK